MKRTPRGFAVYSDFRDTYSNRVRIQQSSSAMRHAVWIFCDGESDGQVLVGDQTVARLCRARRMSAIRAYNRPLGQAG